MIDRKISYNCKTYFDTAPMLTETKMHGILKELAKVRPVFHSEDDFKFALAWKIEELYPRSDIRLEYPIRFSKNTESIGSMYVDLLVTLGGMQFPIELKYKTRTKYRKKTLELEFSGETFHLAGHGAENENRYRFWRDVWRIENSGFRKDL